MAVSLLLSLFFSPSFHYFLILFSLHLLWIHLLFLNLKSIFKNIFQVFGLLDFFLEFLRPQTEHWGLSLYSFSQAKGALFHAIITASANTFEDCTWESRRLLWNFCWGWEDEGREEILCYLLFGCSCLCIPDVWREQGFLPWLTSGALLTMSCRNESEQLLVWLRRRGEKEGEGKGVARAVRDRLRRDSQKTRGGMSTGQKL